MLTTVPEEMKKAAVRSNLPPGSIFCNPEIGYAHGSLKSPLTDLTDLHHYTEVYDSFQTTYLLSAVDLLSPNSSMELHFISVKHHLEEGWYFADGAVLSTDGTCVKQFLLDKPIYDRGPQPVEEMNGIVQRIVPKMLRKSGVPSIQPLLRLLKYTWLVSCSLLLRPISKSHLFML